MSTRQEVTVSTISYCKLYFYLFIHLNCKWLYDVNIHFGISFDILLNWNCKFYDQMYIFPLRTKSWIQMFKYMCGYSMAKYFNALSLQMLSCSNFCKHCILIKCRTRQGPFNRVVWVSIFDRLFVKTGSFLISCD